MFEKRDIPPTVLAQGALFLAAEARDALGQTGTGPWSTLAFRRFGDVARINHTFDEGNVTLEANPDGSFNISTGGFNARAVISLITPTEAVTQFDGNRTQSTIISVGNKLHVFTESSHYILHRPQAAADESTAASASADNLVSPMPATVIDVRVKPGDKVTTGQVCAVLESMKMEINIRAGRDGVIGKVGASKGMTVEEGSILVVLEPEVA